MQVERAALLQTLEMVSPGLSPKGSMQSDCFALKAGRVYTFNDEVSCRAKTDLPAEFAGAAPAVQLLETLRQIADPEVELVAADGFLSVRTWTLKAGGGRRYGRKVDVRLNPAIELPFASVERPGAWGPLHPDFCEAVKTVIGSAGTRPEEFVSTCVHVHPDWVEATDRRQGCRYSLRTGVEAPFLVRWKSVRHVLRLGVTEFALSDTWVHFRNPVGLVVSCRRWADPYPDITPAFAVRGEPITLPKGLAGAAKLTGIFAEADGAAPPLLDVMVEGKTVRVRGRGSKGRALADVPVQYGGPPVRFPVQGKLLEEVVARETRCEISPTRLRVDGEKWVYVVSLTAPKAEGVKEE